MTFDARANKVTHFVEVSFPCPFAQLQELLRKGSFFQFQPSYEQKLLLDLMKFDGRANKLNALC